MPLPQSPTAATCSPAISRSSLRRRGQAGTTPRRTPPPQRSRAAAPPTFAKRIPSTPFPHGPAAPPHKGSCGRACQQSTPRTALPPTPALQMPGYSSAELLALRSMPPSDDTPPTTLTPAPPRPTEHSPRRSDHAQLMAAVGESRVSFAFAHYPSIAPASTVIVPSATTASSVQFAAGTHSDQLFDSTSVLSRLVRYGRGIASLNLYPASARDLQVNSLLWRVAQRGEYDPLEGNLLLETNVLALAMPLELFSFLSTISESDLRCCMLEVLALIAEDEDAEGLALMKSELEATMWKQLTDYMTCKNGSAPRLDQSTAHGQKLLLDVQRLLRLCYLSPWKIDVYACYVTPQDMSAVLLDSTKSVDSSSASSLLHQGTSDRRLVRSRARRPVSVTPLVSPTLVAPRCRLTNKNIVFWKLFQDWRRYRKVLVQGLAVNPGEVAKTMMHSIARGTQEEAWERAEKVMACAVKQGNLLSSLPKDVVYNLIGPHVLLAGSRS